MTAYQLINDTIPPLKLSDNCEKAMHWFNNFHINHLPVVDKDGYVGLINEFDILDGDAGNSKLSASASQMPRIFAYENAHFYELVKIISEGKLSLLPILDEDENYLGVVTLDGVFEYMAQSSAMQEKGGVIILRMSENDYSLSEIAQIIETNDAKILSLYVQTLPNSTQMDVTLKINKTDLKKVIKTFNRYEYKIKAYFQEETMLEDMQERLDSFLNYMSF